MKQHAGTLASAVKDVIEIEPLVEAEELDTVRRETLRAERSTLISLLTDGIISEEVYSQLARQIDLQLSRDQQTWINLIKEQKLELAEIDLLISAIVQIQDVENAINALTQEGILVTRLSSSGGFLGRRNVTLLIGIQKDLLESVTKIPGSHLQTTSGICVHTLGRLTLPFTTIDSGNNRWCNSIHTPG